MSENWRPRTLGECVRITKGITYASSDYASGDAGEIFLTIKCFAKGGGFNPEGVKYYKGVYVAEQEVKPGDLLIAKTDLTRDGDIVGSPMVAPDFGGERKVLPSMDLSVLRPADDQTDIRFLFYRMMLGDARRYMWAHSAGSTVLHLETKALPRLRFLSPPPTEQCRIATILTTLDEVIEATEKLVEKHQQIKAGLMHDLFTRGLWTRPELARGDHKGLPCEATAQEGQLRPPPEEAPGLYQDSPLGLIPKGWSRQSLGQCVNFIGGSGFPEILQGGQTGEVPFYKVSDQSLPGNEKYLRQANNYVSFELARKMGWRIAPQDGVAFAKVGAALLLNRRRILTQPSLVDNNMMVTVAANHIHPLWLYWWFLRINFSLLVQPGALPSINQSQLSALPLAVPFGDEQASIGQRLEAIDAKIEIETTHLAKLRQQKQGLMHDLLTGRVRVEATP